MKLTKKNILRLKFAVCFLVCYFSCLFRPLIGLIFNLSYFKPKTSLMILRIKLMGYDIAFLNFILCIIYIFRSVRVNCVVACGNPAEVTCFARLMSSSKGGEGRGKGGGKGSWKSLQLLASPYMFRSVCVAGR